jgi:hypothetical protein
MKTRINSLLGALADAITACFFLTLWFSPMAFGPEAVRVAFMLVLVEFLLIHATFVLGSEQRRSTAGCLPMVGFGGGYLLVFIVAALSYESMWPLFAFAWLLIGKMFTGAITGHEELWNRNWHNGIWMLSFVAWIGLILLVVVLPIPQVGMTPEALAQVDAFAISGALVDHPQKLMVFGAAYFMLLAAAKLTGFNVFDYFSVRAEDRRSG